MIIFALLTKNVGYKVECEKGCARHKSKNDETYMTSDEWCSNPRNESNDVGDEDGWNTPVCVR